MWMPWGDRRCHQDLRQPQCGMGEQVRPQAYDRNDTTTTIMIPIGPIVSTTAIDMIGLKFIVFEYICDVRDRVYTILEL